MNKGIIGVLVILMGAVIIGGLVYYMFFREEFVIDTSVVGVIETEERSEGSNKDLTRKVDVITVDINDGEKIDEVITEKKERKVRQFGKEDLKRMASSFAERFGSYSNHSNFNNIQDLRIFMSEEMDMWAEVYIGDKKKSDVEEDVYYGIVTKAISQEVLNYDDDTGRATILVGTRRREAIGETNNISNTFDQEVVISFLRERGIWKVNKAIWKDK